MLKNLSLTLIATAVLSACGSGGDGSVGMPIGDAKMFGSNQAGGSTDNADEGGLGNSGANAITPNKNNTNNQNPNPQPPHSDTHSDTYTYTDNRPHTVAGFPGEGWRSYISSRTDDRRQSLPFPG